MQDILRILIPVVVTHALVLLIIIFVIKKLLLNDTMQAVARIRRAEAEVRKREESIQQEIANHEREFQRKKTEAEEELQAKREASEKDLSRLREQIIDEAKREASKLLDQARKDEANIRQQVLKQMEEKAVDYGAELFRLVFSERITSDLNNMLISELLDALDEIDGDTITVETDEVVVRSSHPMGIEQKERLRKLLMDKFGIDVKINEDVDDTLIGGLILKLGSLEIDGSLRTRFEEATEEVKKTST